MPGFKSKYETLCDRLAFSPLEHVEKDSTAINSNRISSALTALASVLALDVYRSSSAEQAQVYSGYSVGQWTALYAAGVLNFESLIEVIAHRASLMDACSAKRPGGMLAVIGVAPEPLLELCVGLSSPEEFITISNYNCYGQYTLSGDVALIEVAQEAITKLSPKKVARIPVAGAWHSAILDDAAFKFKQYLGDCDLKLPMAQVVDNVTGDYVPLDLEPMLQTLGKHVSHSVQWHKSVKRLLADGVTECVEVGYGNTLTKFGMFIDRSIEHRAYFPTPIAV